MDTDTCEREGTNAGEDQCSTTRRRDPGRGNDHSEMASVPAPARHSAEIRGREYAAGYARCKLGVGIANTSTDKPDSVGWQLAIVKPTTFGIFA